MIWIASSRSAVLPSATRAFALLIGASVATSPLVARAESPAPVAREQPDDVAVVVTQAVGVGPLADRLAEIAAAHLESRGLRVIRSGEAARRLRELGGRDPLTCGSDATCLGSIGETLGTRRILAVGLGRFAGMYGLDLRAIDRGAEGDAAVRNASGTWAEPGPDWETAMRTALEGVLPAPASAPAPAPAPAEGKLLVHAADTGAELRIDGAPVGTVPLASPISLAAGVHRIELRSEGRGAVEREVTIESGALADIELALAPVVADLDDRPAWYAPAKWTASGVAVAALAGAIATHLAASSTMDDAGALKDAGKPFASTRQDALDTLGTARILYGVAAAAGAGAATLWFLDRPAETK